MKILLVSQRYWPENFSVVNLAEELVKKGNEVTVLTGLPNYPQGFIFEGYERKKNRHQYHNGVEIIRVNEVPRKHGPFHRLLNYCSFPVFGSKEIKKMGPRFDVVFANELSPIMSVLPAITYKEKFNRKVLMYEMDLWPESLLAGGIKKNSLIYNHYLKKSAYIYSKMDKILVSTCEHIEYIKKLPGCAELDIDYLPQYAEDIFENSRPKTNVDPKMHFMFAGNIGKAQNIKLIIESANILKENDSLVFDIFGDGSEKIRMEQYAKSLSLSNVIFHGAKQKSEMPSFYSLADAMIVTLEDNSFTRMTLPGKVQSYMAAGKPILSAAPGATNELIQKADAGIVVSELSPRKFAEACLFLCSCNKLPIFAANSSRYYKDHFSKEIFFTKLLGELEDLKK